MITASLRATATTARLCPRLAAIFMPQAFRVLCCFERAADRREGLNLVGIQLERQLPRRDIIQ